MRVRFFAGAAEAAGVDELVVADAGQTGHDLVTVLAEGNQRLGEVLRVSSLLADGARVADLSAPLGVVDRVDVLPPFAGG
ncbi:Molybdopterin converting factor, small subunit [Tessaracoccus bendigoensis DSM 12906]|uniref:Molybdopterin converting factor, small subunit n=1 Tax=Tessaracoccus bendigoensis DSM 12906 TaxID=1123357 RepID=A0A1M6IIG8_9ACTN|nr:MoaD/ThiS family protein [Tessaracoccus bendigoensis]SHJ34225.1 Molybdopterin converting factor, small subunit [Tessaracoccus bendigoensis DSM 12906]